MAGDQPEQWHDQEGNQCELPLDQEDRYGVRDQAEGVRRSVPKTGNEERLDGRHVAGQPRDEISYTPVLEEIHRQALHVPKDIGPKIRQEPLTQPFRQDIVHVGDEST